MESIYQPGAFSVPVCCLDFTLHWKFIWNSNVSFRQGQCSQHDLLQRTVLFLSKLNTRVSRSQNHCALSFYKHPGLLTPVSNILSHHHTKKSAWSGIEAAASEIRACLRIPCTVHTKTFLLALLLTLPSHWKPSTEEKGREAINSIFKQKMPLARR